MKEEVDSVVWQTIEMNSAKVACQSNHHLENKGRGGGDSMLKISIGLCTSNIRPHRPTTLLQNYGDEPQPK